MTTPAKPAAPKKERKDPMKRRQLILPDELWNGVSEVAEASDVSASAIVRYAIRDYLNRRARAKKLPRPS